MDATTIQELYRYNQWANGRVFEAVGALPTEEFVRAVPSSFPSVRETLTHVVWGEWLWLRRWKGNSPTTIFGPSESPDASALRARWTEVQAEQTEFVRSLTNEHLQKVVRYVNLQGQPWAYALWKQMLHVVNHSTYHRGQITTMLRQLGARPSPTDLLVFYDEEPSTPRSRKGS